MATLRLQFSICVSIPIDDDSVLSGDVVETHPEKLARQLTKALRAPVEAHADKHGFEVNEFNIDYEYDEIDE